MNNSRILLHQKIDAASDEEIRLLALVAVRLIK